jgi:hypothetical protein
MELKIPINDVSIEIVDRKIEIQEPHYSDGFYRINQNEFTLDVEKVAWFHVTGGNSISVFPYPEAEARDINLYLNGSVFGAILHQREVLPLHGSSFIFNGQGILICGDSGAGKSSVTASFCLNGAEFLTDDITPVIFEDKRPFIWTMSDRIKLWSDSLRQLNKQEEGLQRIYSETDKYYYHFGKSENVTFPLNMILILETHENATVRSFPVSGTSGFASLRNEIYRHEYLHGMPENERIYFGQLVDICSEVKVGRIYRPREITIEELRGEIIRFIKVFNE